MSDGIYVLVPIMALGIAVTGIISSSILKMKRLSLEEARLRADAPADMVNDLARQVSDMQQELSEVQERLDFAERLLAQGRETPGLPPPPQSP